MACSTKVGNTNVINAQWEKLVKEDKQMFKNSKLPTRTKLQSTDENNFKAIKYLDFLSIYGAEEGVARTDIRVLLPNLVAVTLKVTEI